MRTDQILLWVQMTSQLHSAPRAHGRASYCHTAQKVTTLKYPSPKYVCLFWPRNVLHLQHIGNCQQVRQWMQWSAIKSSMQACCRLAAAAREEMQNKTFSSTNIWRECNQFGSGRPRLAAGWRGEPGPGLSLDLQSGVCAVLQCCSVTPPVLQLVWLPRCCKNSVCKARG